MAFNRLPTNTTSTIFQIPEYADLSLKNWVMVAGKACSFGLSFSLNAEMLKKGRQKALCVIRKTTKATCEDNGENLTFIVAIRFHTITW